MSPSKASLILAPLNQHAIIKTTSQTDSHPALPSLPLSPHIRKQQPFNVIGEQLMQPRHAIHDAIHGICWLHGRELVEQKQYYWPLGFS